jgi:23S rRNA (cytosine1962-C5)-methyltransferase
VWSWSPDDTIDAAFISRRLRTAVALRARLERGGMPETQAERLVHAESDGFPGLIVDRYGVVLVVQFLSAGAERWRETIIEGLQAILAPASVYERSDAEVRRLEGLEQRTGLLAGVPPPELVKIREQNREYWVDIRNGHKTGFYLDQRSNRSKIAALASGKLVLDCFAYTGGFSIAAQAGGARHVTALEASMDCLDLLGKNQALNRLPEEQLTKLQGDVFSVLRTLRDRASSFDLVILDPPKFAPTARLAQKAARGYKDINRLALLLLRPGGLLATFSCSAGVGMDLFQKIVAGAALDAGVDAQLLDRMTQAADHPVALNFPEGAYLKGLLVGVP